MSEHYDFHYQPTGSGAISGQQVLEQTEDAINELGDYVNDNVGGAMDVAQQALETAQNAEQDAQTALDTANSFSDAIQSAQQDASTALSTAQTAQTTATNANNTATQAQQDANTAVTTANNASGQVSTLSGTVTTLGQRVTTAEGNIGQNTSDITALTTRVGTAEDNITTLQNDVTIAQGNASSAMATAGQVKQQAFVFRYSSTALVASSTNSNTLLDNTDNLKVGDKVIDSSGVLFSITAIDSVNSTFTVGSALVDLALDANVVHTAEINSSGIGIIEAVKEVGGVDFNTLTTQGLYGTNASGSINNPQNSPCVVQVIKRLSSVIQIANVSSSAYKSRYIRYCADVTAQSPVWQSWIKFATDDEVVHKSGDETITGNKTFSSINGVEPSSLSLPSDRSARIDISSYFTNTGSGNTNNYSVPANGFIFLNLLNTFAVICYSTDGTNNINYAQSFFRQVDGQIYILFPVRKNDTFRTLWTSNGGTITVTGAHFIPCLGNV